MKVLVLAPHPFYQERGTPIAVDLLLRALSERGDHVDLLTFHEGTQRQYPNVTIYRIRPWPRVSGIRPGFSLKKLHCDAYLFIELVKRLRKEKYDVIHAVEEGAFMALLVQKFTGTPFVYDMDSSMVTQLIDKYAGLRMLERPLRYAESLPMRRAASVIPVCEALAQDVRKYRTDNDIVVLKDVSLMGGTTDNEDAEDLRAEYGLRGKLVLYIGNLESYQGIDLLLRSFAVVASKDADADLVIIGGEDSDIEKYRGLADELKVAANVHLLGKRPVKDIGAYMLQADILVSPRTKGVNTPMKVYSYLHSGVPVLATDLPTHTQVMTDEIAKLAPPEPAAFGAAMAELLADTELRSRLGTRARAFIEREHSYEAFKATLYELYAKLEAFAPAGEGGRVR